MDVDVEDVDAHDTSAAVADGRHQAEVHAKEKPRFTQYMASTGQVSPNPTAWETCVACATTALPLKSPYCLLLLLQGHPLCARRHQVNCTPRAVRLFAQL